MQENMEGKINSIVESIKNLNRQAVLVYKSIVEDICSGRTVEGKELEVSEGDTSDYWMDTATNAIKPLYQLLALAKMRPDCIWDGD